MEAMYIYSGNQIRPLLLPNHYTVWHKLQTHERMNGNKKKLKELNENDWSTTTCIIQLKSAFVDVLASEFGLHWRFELHHNYSVCNRLQTHERMNRNIKKLKELDKNDWSTTTRIIQLKSAFVDVLASESGLHWRFELHQNYSVHNEQQTHERMNRNNKKLKELQKWLNYNTFLNT